MGCNLSAEDDPGASTYGRKKVKGARAGKKGEGASRGHGAKNPLSGPAKKKNGAQSSAASRQQKGHSNESSGAAAAPNSIDANSNSGNRRHQMGTSSQRNIKSGGGSGPSLLPGKDRKLPARPPGEFFNLNADESELSSISRTTSSLRGGETNDPIPSNDSVKDSGKGRGGARAGVAGKLAAPQLLLSAPLNSGEDAVSQRSGKKQGGGGNVPPTPQHRSGTNARKRGNGGSVVLDGSVGLNSSSNFTGVGGAVGGRVTATAANAGNPGFSASLLTETKLRGIRVWIDLGEKAELLDPQDVAGFARQQLEREAARARLESSSAESGEVDEETSSSTGDSGGSAGAAGSPHLDRVNSKGSIGNMGARPTSVQFVTGTGGAEGPPRLHRSDSSAATDATNTNSAQTGDDDPLGRSASGTVTPTTGAAAVAGRRRSMAKGRRKSSLRRPSEVGNGPTAAEAKAMMSALVDLGTEADEEAKFVSDGSSIAMRVGSQTSSSKNGPGGGGGASQGLLSLKTDASLPSKTRAVP